MHAPYYYDNLGVADDAATSIARNVRTVEKLLNCFYL